MYILRMARNSRLPTVEVQEKPESRIPEAEYAKRGAIDRNEPG